MPVSNSVEIAALVRETRHRLGWLNGSLHSIFLLGISQIYPLIGKL